MSDLSWLNPTPHAIAVYASQPLSPVATQHSLPSRTLPFTWAGLSPAGSHQLCLAHSFDHLVGEAEQRQRHGQPKRRGGVEIDAERVLVGPLHRQVASFGAPEDAIDIARCLQELVGQVDFRAVTDESAVFRKVAVGRNRRQTVA